MEDIIKPDTWIPLLLHRGADYRVDVYESPRTSKLPPAGQLMAPLE